MTQQEALTMLKTGNNVFLTGSAGSGKTYVLNQYIQFLKDHEVEVAVTASTGIAATHMHGMTIHAWSGIGIKDTLTQYEIDALEQKPYLWKRYEKTQVLIIDEISMLSGTFLDTLNNVCQSFKRSEKPFGGMQIVLCGDLFQLPPVTRGNQEPVFVSDSHTWRSMNLIVCYLHEQHRQDDEEFVSLLNAIRDGVVDTEHRSLLDTRMFEDMDGLDDVTKLFTHNVDVDGINTQALGLIDDTEKLCLMTTKGKDVLVDILKRSCLAPERLILKRGAQVMFIKNNTERGYVNGTRGIVERFLGDGTPVVKTLDGKAIEVMPEVWAIEDDGKVKASITQLPLRHAWAITVHKSQGMSLDSAVIDLSKSFVHGMGYVALSRVRTLEGLFLLGLNEEAFHVDPRIRKVDEELRTRSQKTVGTLEKITPDERELLIKGFVLRSGGVMTVSPSKKKNLSSKKESTQQKTLELIEAGKSIEEVAKIREYTIGTIISHLEKMRDTIDVSKISHLRLSEKDMMYIHEAYRESDDDKLTPVKSLLDKKGCDYDFETIRIARLFLK
ncbi:AAA family ATPase [Candidatus Nomurabacteria bacterium]|nr:AAA family ATPase [Candidatus Nomurabacteria bacterium]